ncbi:MAG: hypothetical protein Q8N63_01325 [Nanoarchaeota archaeon]|nr:hypothetical protein [Nanoarchaeota archaeon]
MKNKILDKDKSKEFLLEFFKDFRIKDEKGILTISEVPADFEEFVGKKSPYKFVFDINLHNKVKDSELIMQGSYFLLAIRDYLSDKGQTSLLKINIKSDLRELSKNPKLKKYRILEIKESNSFLYEFLFLSTYQYLNHKKQSTNTVLVKDKEVLDMDIARFKIQKGNGDDIAVLDPQESYRAAKKILDEKVSKEIKLIKLILKEKLQKELFRVKDHYFKQIKEKDEEVETCTNKIKMLQSKLRHTSYERDISILKRMIMESKERLEMLKKKSYRERLRAEEVFHINDEVEKHALSIKNVLINTTVFYYPVYNIVVSSKGKKVMIKYDSVLDEIV